MRQEISENTSPQKPLKLRGKYFGVSLYKAASTSHYSTFSLRINQSFLN